MRAPAFVASLLLGPAVFASAASDPVPGARPGGEQPSAYEAILPLRERATLRDRIVAERLETVVPPLLRELGIDAWVLVAREYNEDPVLETMLPSSWFAARRRTILVFLDQGEEGVERLAVSRYPITASTGSELFAAAWNPEDEPDQWKRLAALLAERDPARIALDGSERFAHADGLTHFEHEALVANLSPELRRRIVFDDRLGVGWLETRTPMEVALYPSLCAIAHAIIAEGFSPGAVRPGETTTEDLEWWFRERIVALDLDTWFHPHVSFQRPGGQRTRSFAVEQGSGRIERGDLLHVDFGITYLGLNTDTQQHAYVLREGERAAPPGLRAGLRTANLLQDLLTTSFETGRSGNEILQRARERAAAEGIDASIYTHPLGNHGHGAGPTIGLWDRQEGVPGSGDYALRPSTVFSIELNAKVAVPEWSEAETLFMLEEDAIFDGTSVRYLDGRQTELILIP